MFAFISLKRLDLLSGIIHFFKTSYYSLFIHGIWLAESLKKVNSPSWYKSKLAIQNCTLFSCNQRRMANTFDCEPYLRALEEQADSIGGAANGMLQAMGTYRENAGSVLRSVENLKKMVQMTRKAMVLAHGNGVIEKVEIKREPE